MAKAEAAGRTLAQAISQTNDWKFTLAGHSLGARVIFYALQHLSKDTKITIENVYLLGGAVGGSDKDDNDWKSATRAVNGKIFNLHSKNDEVLKYLYQAANIGASTPIGFKPIHLQNPKIVNKDCSDTVHGHMKWKNEFGKILTQINTKSNYHSC